MRWPLRYQLMLLAAAMMAVVLLLVSATTSYLSANRAQAEIESDVRQLASALADARYPLTSPVLKQIHEFSGVLLVLVDAKGQPLATSGGIEIVALPTAADEEDATKPDKLQLGEPQQIGSARFFHTAIRITPPLASTANSASAGAPRTLHLFYPEDRWREARRQAMLLPWMVGLVALPLVVLLALLFAARLSRPIVRLRDHVRQITSGQYTARVMVTRGDEVGELAGALNDLAEQLDRFDHETRHSERLRVLNQLGSGIAHQMRNAVTGALLAADVHERSGDHESLDMVRRQLRLIESNVKRFLALSQPAEPAREQLKVTDIVREAISLVEPAFKHVHVELNLVQRDNSAESNAATASPTVQGNRDALHDVLTNLLLNAMEATASQPADSRRVTVSIGSENERQTTTVCVADTGLGPPAEILDNLFEPFATSKPEGTGLGLFVAQRTMQDHGGSIRWQRNGEQTEFVLVFGE